MSKPNPGAVSNAWFMESGEIQRLNALWDHKPSSDSRPGDPPSASRTSPSTRDEEENSDANSPACRPPTRRHVESVP